MAHDFFPDTSIGKLAVNIYDQDIADEEHGDFK